MKPRMNVILCTLVILMASAAAENESSTATVTATATAADVINVIASANNTRSAIKYCADLSPLRAFVEANIEPYYRPLIGMLPDYVRMTLLAEADSLGGFTYASCLVATFALLTIMLVWFVVARYMRVDACNVSERLNECVLSLKLALNEANLKANTFEYEIVTLQTRVKESESKAALSMERLEAYKSSTETTERALEKLRESESRSLKELNTTRLELVEARDSNERQRVDYESLHAQYVDVCERLQSSECLVAELRQRQQQQQVELEQRSLPQQQQWSSSSRVVITSDDTLVAERIRELEENVTRLESSLAAKQLECLTLSDAVKLGEDKLKDFDRQLKENEIQIRLLNDLREKDTKQHVKSIVDLDNQLKKKKTEAEKTALLLDQLRAKSERIHELESQFARVEKQSTSDRHAFEKQAHEQWLQSRKTERELKEAKTELSALKERLADCEASLKAALGENVTLKYRFQQQQQQQQQQPYFMPRLYPDDLGSGSV